MKNTFKKLLPVIIVALVMVAAFAVTAFATDDWVIPVQILNMSQSGVEKSGYTDIDGNEDWIQVSTSTDAKAAAYKQSNFYWTCNFRSYFNAQTKTYVVIPSWSGNTLSGRDALSSNPAGTAPGDKALTAAEVESLNSEYYTKRYVGDASYVYIVHCINAWMIENRNNIEHVEFRPYNGTATATAVIAEAFGSSVADDFVNVKTVKYTPTFSFRSAGDAPSNYNKIFENKTKLTTVQYGTFAQNGEFSTNCPENAVSLTEGPKTDSKFGISNIIFKGCTSITRVIVDTNTSQYIGFRNDMFNGCTSLKFVRINVAMSDAYKVGTDAFAGCEGVNVYVDNTAAATGLAAVTNITLKAHTAYDADIKEYFSKNAPIYAEGVLIKIANTGTASGDNVAIRFIFKWDAANTPAMGTPVKVGVVACTADYYDNLGTGLEEEKLATLIADTNTARVKKNDIAIYEDGELTLVGKFLAEGTDVANGIYSYAYTLYGIPVAHYDSEIYAATYIQWADGSYSVASNHYDDPTTTDVVDKNEKNTLSLYDATLGLFKRGLINSEKVADTYLWDVIEGYAAWTMEYAEGKYATGTNSECLFLPDNIDGGYVMAYRAIKKYAEDGVTLAGASLPHSGQWYSPQSLESARAYFYQSNAFVIDHGITWFGGARVVGANYTTTVGDYATTTGNLVNTSIETVVYPSGLTTNGSVTSSNNGSHAFQCCNSISNVIWCHTDANGNYVPHMSDIEWNQYCTDKTSLWDLRGFIRVVAGNVTTSDAIKNIILKKGTTAFEKGNAVVWAES